MRTGQTHLFIPGPTNVPEAVRQAMNVPMQDMHAADFWDLTLGLFEGVKSVLRTETGRVMFFPGSGSGAWEAAITNTLSPGDRVLMARHGQFSALWVEMAKRLGLDVEVIDVPWGAGVPVKEFSRRLGMDVVVGLLGSLKGYASVASEPDRGTTVRVVIPLEESA